MDMQWMKRIDRFAGVPICAALTLYERARGRDKARPGVNPRAPDLKDIGVIKFWGMGSLILAAPVFYAMRNTNPGARIHLITLEQNRGIVELLHIADQVHYLDLPESAPGVAWNILRFFSSVREIGLDAVIDLEYLSRFSAIVTSLSRAPVRVGFHSWDVWRGDLHNNQRAFNPYWHVTLNFMNLERALCNDSDEPSPVKLNTKGDEKERAMALLHRKGVQEGEQVIAVNPNASTVALARRWPEGRFVELIDRINREALGRVVLLGTPGEAEFVQGVRKRARDPDAVVSLAGESSLRDLVGVLQRSDLLITNDSGPLHLADALGTKTVSFFGPETPQLFGPRGPGHVVLYRGIDCSPCINIYNAKTVRCMRDEPECLTGISVDEAFAAVKRALGEAG